MGGGLCCRAPDEPRSRDEVGDVRLVLLEDPVFGGDASWGMAAFHRDFGVYWSAADEAVAIAESSFHRARFLRESRIDQSTQEMRVILAQLRTAALLHLRHLGDTICESNDYREAAWLGSA
ncbi:MAG: hypothetical protein P1U54_05385 [Immundisolibacteraceae bacterium]|nr:hypothetical protein [Immundisolibacteraceae bacterium]